MTVHALNLANDFGLWLEVKASDVTAYVIYPLSWVCLRRVFGSADRFCGGVSTLGSREESCDIRASATRRRYPERFQQTIRLNRDRYRLSIRLV